MPYYIVVNLEAFVLCFSGEYLNSKVRKREEKDCEHIFAIDINWITDFGIALI